MGIMTRPLTKEEPEKQPARHTERSDGSRISLLRLIRHLPLPARGIHNHSPRRLCAASAAASLSPALLPSLPSRQLVPASASLPVACAPRLRWRSAPFRGAQPLLGQLNLRDSVSKDGAAYSSVSVLLLLLLLLLQIIDALPRT